MQEKYNQERNVHPQSIMQNMKMSRKSLSTIEPTPNSLKNTVKNHPNMLDNRVEKALHMLENKYNQAELDQYLMGIKQMSLDKKLDFKKYFNSQATQEPHSHVRLDKPKKLSSQKIADDYFQQDNISSEGSPSPPKGKI